MNELMNEILIIPLHFCRYTDEELYKLQHHIAKNAIP